jgi:hypothetical protein
MCLFLADVSVLILVTILAAGAIAVACDVFHLSTEWR